MITLKQWLETVGYRITEGSEYTWRCYGPHAHVLDSWNGEQDGHSFSVVFDTKTQEVYEVQAHDYQRGRAYRWFGPGCEERYKKECEEHDSVENEAWEGVDYVTLEMAEDWMDKAYAIANSLDYDTRVQVPIDFSDEELLRYMKMAHERDQTFNEFVEEALRAAIEQHKSDPHAEWD